jgi:hypothetical protein
MADKKTPARSPNLRPPWRKGETGNARGRPRGKSLRKLLALQDLPDPKVFLLGVMHDGRRAMKLRVEAAKAVIGYVHPRLANIEARVGMRLDLTRYDAKQLDQLLALVELGEIEERPTP